MSQNFPFVSRIPGQTSKPNNCGGSYQADAPAAEPVSMAAVTGTEIGLAPVVKPGQEPKKKVVVVGAGIAGLRAAAVLHRHGLEIVVLEGRDRIGGRIWTIEQEGTGGKKSTRDMGAAWMHETSQNPLVKLIRELNMTYYYDDGFPLYYTKHGRAGSQFKAKKVAEEFADYAEWYYETYPNAKDQSVDEFIHTFVDQHELITEDERLWAPQVIRDIEHMLGTTTAEASAKHLIYYVTERNLYMKDGYDPIVQWTAKPIPKDVIQLNRLVKQIDWNENGTATIQYQADGKMETIAGDAVIVTVPLGALHHNLISFNPPLPDDLQMGISKLSYGALGKVFFEFSEIFWSKENDQFIYYASPPHLGDEDYDAELSSSSSSGSDESGESDNILNYPTTTVNLSLVADNTKELCVQIVEPLTQRIEAISHDKKKLYKFFQPLFRLLRTEPYKALPKLVNIDITSWTQDPLSGFGTYSTEKVNDDPTLLQKAVEKHAGSKLQLAGEHCAVAGAGCVHGAFASGEISARNLLASFGVPYDGGDLVSVKLGPSSHPTATH